MAIAILMLFVIIGLGQTIWLKSSIAPFLKIPLDGGLSFRGRRIFGAHKTLRGFVLIVPLATLIFALWGISPKNAPWDLSVERWASAGFLIGLAYMLAELPNSFLKRQLDIGEGQSGGWFFDLLDESDSVLGAVAAGAMVLPIDRGFVLTIVPAGILLHLGFNRLLIQRKKPWPEFYFLAFFVLSLLLVLPRSFGWRLTRRLTRIGLWSLGIQGYMRGGLAKQTQILLCNHSSWLDQLVLLALIERPLVFIAHKKYFAMPLLGWVLRRQGGIVKPESLREARKLREELQDALAKGCLLIVFPEATRSEQGFPLPLRSRLRFLPEDVSWQAAWISGAAHCLPRAVSLFRVRPGRVGLSFLDLGGSAKSFSAEQLRCLWLEHWIKDQLQSLADAQDPRCFGEKAARLAQAQQRGYAVPDGLVLSSELCERLEDPLEPELGTLLEKVLTNHYPELLVQTLAVRSSAIGEDGEQQSFAGQLESVLNVKGSAACLAAVRTVLQSRQRAEAYEALFEKSLQGLGIILQIQVPARFAGVGFSRIQYRDRLSFAIEYAEGLGEDLVQGRVNPARAIFNRDTGLLELEENPSSRPLLAGSTLGRLYALGRKLEQDWAQALDFEWALDDEDKLFLLQLRPITGDDRLQKVWSNANMNENYPRPVTPFLYSLAADGYRQYFRQLGDWTGVPKRLLDEMSVDLQQILGIHEGRLYYDLSAVRRCLGVLPFGKTLIRFWDEFLGVGPIAFEPPKSRRAPVWFAPLFLLRLGCLMLVFPWLARRFYRRVENLPPADAGSELRSILAIRLHGWGEAALCDAAVMIHTGLLRLALGNERQLALLAESESISLQQLEDLRSLQDELRAYAGLQELLQNAQWDEAWLQLKTSARYRSFFLQCQRWLDLWGTRVSGELMLTESNYHDEPRLFLQVLAAPVPPRKSARGPQTPLLLSLLAAPARAAIRSRELCRLAQSRLYGRLRARLLATGKTLASRQLLLRPDDVFFLGYEEVLSLLEERCYALKALQGSIALRRELYQSFQGRKQPERMGRRQGRPLFSKESLMPSLVTTANRSGSIQERQGLPASRGLVKGRVRIALSTEDCSFIQTGDVLVTRETDPGWTVALGRVAALVVERGGMLSHGAIVARELGIPAVIGLADIIDELEDGMEIEVDGQKGTVTWPTGCAGVSASTGTSPSPAH